MSTPATTGGGTAIDLAALHQAQRSAVEAFGAPPKNLAGKGIVTSVYDREFPSGWVLLRELSRLHVPLPVEAWHRPDELTDRQRKLLKSLDLDLTIKVLDDPVDGFAVKPFAIWRSAFRAVLWIDCDNFPIRDPSFLFDDPEYKQKGSLFWRDVSGVERGLRWHPRAPVWRVFDVPPNDAEEFETGQLLIDKGRCWPELGLTLHFNREREVYYRFVYGDKDTFRLSWQNLAAKRGPVPSSDYLSNPKDVPYGFMPFGPFHMGTPNPAHRWGGGSVMVQRDRYGAPIFNHRNLYKLRLDGTNLVNRDIFNETLYHEHIAELTRLLKR